MARDPVVAALILAAGRGQRLGAGISKAFVLLDGKTLVERSIRALHAGKRIDRIVPVVADRDLSVFEGLRGSFSDISALVDPVSGGAERQDSMRAGLASLSDDVEFVAVHDAARCLVDPQDLERVIDAAIATGAAILGERVRDTIKRVVDGRIVESPDRSNLWAAQTPQVFRRDWLEAATTAGERAGLRVTDDAALVEAQGYSVSMVEARSPNPKITRPEDLVLARGLLEAGRRA